MTTCADPTAMTGVVRLIQRAGDDAFAALHHATTYADLSFPLESGYLLALSGPHRHAYDAITRTLSRASVLAADLAVAVERARLSYVDADERAARRFAEVCQSGATTGPGGRAAAGSSGGPWRRPPLFADAVQPRLHLSSPAAARPSDAFAINLLDQSLSASAWVRQACQTLFGRDPVADWASQTTGDWPAYARCSVAWAQVGAATTDIGRNLTRCAEETPVVWQGPAADAFVAFLRDVAGRLTRLGEVCDFYAARYADAVDAVRELTELAADLLGDLCDVVSILVVSADLSYWLMAVDLVFLPELSATMVFWLWAGWEILGEFMELMARGHSTFTGLAGVMDAYHASRTTPVPMLPGAVPAL